MQEPSDRERAHLPRMVLHACWAGPRKLGYRLVPSSGGARSPAVASGVGDRDVAAVHHRWWTWARMRWS